MLVWLMIAISDKEFLNGRYRWTTDVGQKQ